MTFQDQRLHLCEGENRNLEKPKEKKKLYVSADPITWTLPPYFYLSWISRRQLKLKNTI